MTSDDSGVQDRRETRSAKLREKAREGGEARADYDAAQQATEDNTMRLKALRLKNEQADQNAAKKADKKNSSSSRAPARCCVVGKHVRACPYDPYDHLHPQSPFPAGHTVCNGARSV
jgi:hypothetical protein